MRNERCAKKQVPGGICFFAGDCPGSLGDCPPALTADLAVSDIGMALPRRCWLALLPLCTFWGGCFRRCRLDLTSHKPFAPIPPTRARRALFPRWGRGRDFCYLLQGASPLATPSLYWKVCWLTGGLPETPGASPSRVPKPARYAVSRPAQPRGCRGRSPRQNKLKVPLPQRGRGAGGWGRKI